MNAVTQVARGTFTSGATTIDTYEDPLDEDTTADHKVVATRRGLTRLALIAAETGARFQREGVEQDPMGWLLAPRRLFGGGTAIDAVLGRQDFMRALLLHGLSIGLDAEPEFIDGLVDEDGGGEGQGPEDRSEDLGIVFRDRPSAGGSEEVRGLGRAIGGSPDAGGSAPGERQTSYGGAPRLFTAMLVHHDDGTTLHAFHASVCGTAAEAYGRIAARYGPDAAGTAELMIGFDPTTAFVEAMVSPALSELLQLVASEPGCDLAAGLDLNLEQRFAA